ncbi:MAG: radical SAM protein [Anaerolineae bacterium]
MSVRRPGVSQSAGLREIQVSAGTAAVLGLLDLKMDTSPTTAYLLLGGRCLMNCGFCAQARDSTASALYLSRITWPPFPLEETAGRIAQAFAQGSLRRACLQVTVGPHDFEQALEVVLTLRRHSPIPIDVSILPNSMDEVRRLFGAGVNHIGFGLDAACERVFRLVKGGSWRRSLEMIEETAEAFPGRAAVHLIVGLGETEQEMVERIAWMHQRGITVGLFAFTPLRGTGMEQLPAPALSHYRRMQAARYLICHGLARLSDFTFDEGGRLTDIALPAWRRLLEDGKAFETSGCPDCNRPYYNERPAGPMYNYPRPLSAEEAQQAIEEMELAGGA